MRRIRDNLRFFLPLLFKLNPFSIVFLILDALLSAANNFLWIIFPARIIALLTESAGEDVLMRTVVLFVALKVFIEILSGLFRHVNDALATAAGFKIDKLFNDKVATIDYFHIEDPAFADELSMARKGLDNLSPGIYATTQMIRGVVSAVITIAGVIAIVISSREYLVMGLTVLAVLASSLFTGKIQKMSEAFNRSYLRYGRKQWYYNQSMMAFRGQKNLRSYDGRRLVMTKSDQVNKEAWGLHRSLAKRLSLVTSLSTVVDMLVVTLPILLLLGRSTLLGTLTLAGFTLIQGAVTTLNSSAGNLVYDLKEYVQNCAYQEDFIKVMTLSSVFSGGTERIDEIRTVEFRHVSFRYPRTDVDVLKDVSFTIDAHERISLVGLNGSGKTTLIKLLCRFYPVSEGEILVNGLNVNAYRDDDYSKALAVVFQDFKIISFTVKHNIAILDENPEKLRDVLARSQVLERLERLPKKENTYVNKWFDRSGVEFSGGELQEFAFARALYKDASLVILDEPTSALDPQAENEIYRHFDTIVGHKLCIYVSHRLSSCVESDRILVLSGSRIVESGTHAELMKNPDGLYRAMFMKQAAHYL